jgi:transcriptional regulator with XRE-family HTH domain
LLAVLVEARHKAGITQRGLAARLKLPRSYVSKVETGERGIDPVECVAWAKACRVDPVELFTAFVQSLERRP